MTDEKNGNLRESVQCWADSLAIYLANSAQGLSKADARAVRQLFDWPRVLRKSLAIQILEEKLDERIK